MVCPDSVRYDLDVYHDQLVSKCDLFTSENIGFAKASRIFGQKKRIVDLLESYESSEEEILFGECVYWMH